MTEQGNSDCKLVQDYLQSVHGPDAKSVPTYELWRMLFILLIGRYTDAQLDEFNRKAPLHKYGIRRNLLLMHPVVEKIDKYILKTVAWYSLKAIWTVSPRWASSLEVNLARHHRAWHIERRIWRELRRRRELRIGMQLTRAFRAIRSVPEQAGE